MVLLFFFLADAPARYNAWDEFVLYSFYRLIAPSGNEFGAPVSFFAMSHRRIMYNAWGEFVFNSLNLVLEGFIL